MKMEFRGIKAEISKLNGTVDKLVNDFEKMQGDMLIIEDRVTRNEDHASANEIIVKKLQEKVDVLENFSRRNNVKIVGLPEGTEGTEDPVKFFQVWLPQVLGPENFLEVLEIDRAHRALRRRSAPGEKPRTVLIKFLRFQDKEKIIRLAMARARATGGPLMINGNRILFYPDISGELLERRRNFNPAKKILWEKKCKFILRYPAVLKVVMGPNQPNQFFTNPAEAEKFAK